MVNLTVPITILHQLPRSGGTIINRCLGVMDEVIMLSEIHPRSIAKEIQFNPVLQAYRWFHLLKDSEFNQWRRQCVDRDVSFSSWISLVARRAETRGKRLVIREFSHVDFINTPLTNPTFESTAVKMLDEAGLNYQRFAIVRHPLDQWRSFQNYDSLRNSCSIESFLAGYLAFTRMCEGMDYIRYEDFCDNPDKCLQEFCTASGIAFDATYKDRWQGYQSFTGDLNRRTDRQIKVDHAPEIKTPDQLFLKDESLNLAVRRLGYCLD